MAVDLQIQGSFFRTKKGNVDFYYGGGEEAWTGTTAALSGVPLVIRPGKTVGIYSGTTIIEYWWPNSGSTADGDLQLKNISNTGLTYYNGNGLLLTGTTFSLNTGYTNNLYLPISSGQTILNLQTGLTNEINLRISGDTILQNQINIISSATTANTLNFNNYYTTGQTNSLYYPITGGSLNGFIQLLPQSITPTPPSSGNLEFADTQGRISFMGPNGIIATLSKALMSTGQTYYFPPSGGTFQITANTLSGYSITSGDTLFDTKYVQLNKFYNDPSFIFNLNVNKLTGSTLPTGITNSSLKTVGTITGGTWNGNIISPLYGGTGNSGLTQGSIVFVNSGGTYTQNNNNFYIQNTATTLATNTNVGLSVNVNSDFTGTDAINIYGVFDAYLPNSAITSGITGLNTDGSVPIYGVSSSRGTGTSPLQLNNGDLIGGFFGFGAQGASATTYQNLGGFSVSTIGSSTNNLGGQLDFYTKSDGGSLTNRISIGNSGATTFSGDVIISSVSPSLKFITNGDGGLSFVNRTTTLNSLTFNNNINSVGGFGNGVKQNTQTQYMIGSDTGLMIGTSITETFAFTMQGSGGDYTAIAYGNVNTNGFRISYQSAGRTITLTYGTTTIGSVATSLVLNGLRHSLIVVINGSIMLIYIDGGAPVSTSLSAYNFALNGTLSTSNNTTAAFVGTIGQIAIWNRVLSTTSGIGGTNEIAAIYNGGSGTANIPQSGLIRCFQLQDGSGTASDTNTTLGTQYPFTLSGGASWAGIGNGLIPVAGSLQTNQQFAFYKDGINVGEYGQAGFGNLLSGTFLQGNSVYHLINGFYPFIQGNDGSILISKTNVIETSRGLSALSVVDGVAVGSYAQMVAAPSNGMIISGSLGVGTSSPVSKMDVAGGLTIGAGYAGVSSAPTNGLIVQGKTGIGLIATNAMFEVSGLTTSVAGIGYGIRYSGIVRATAANDILTKLDLTGGSFDINTGANTLILSQTLTITTAGTGYTNGTYTNVPLTGGSGSGATAAVIISGGVVTSVTIGVIGTGYAVGNTLSFSNTSVGGTGSGFSSTLIASNLQFSGTTRTSLRVGSAGETAAILPFADNTANIGSTTLRFNTVIATSFQSLAWITPSNIGVSIINASTGVYTTWTVSGNLILNHGNANVEAGYRLDVFTNLSDSPNGAIRTSGPLSAVSGIAHGVYVNNTLNPITNTDVLVGLDISPTFGTNTTAIQTLGTITGGTGYTNQTFTGRVLTGGSGTGAIATITISGGIVTIVTITNGGTGYALSDVLSCSTIGAGSGFAVPVATLGLSGVSNLALRTSGATQLNGLLTISTGSTVVTSASTYNYLILNPSTGNVEKSSSNILSDGILNITGVTIISLSNFGNNGQLNVFANALTNTGLTITLPPASAYTGYTVHIVKTDSSANTVTIKGNNSELINASNTNLLSTQYQSGSYKSNGTQTYIF